MQHFFDTMCFVVHMQTDCCMCERENKRLITFYEFDSSAVSNLIDTTEKKNKTRMDRFHFMSNKRTWWQNVINYNLCAIFPLLLA